jgi:type I restriction enzyme S subunit
MIQAFRDHSQGFAKDRHRLYFHHFAAVLALRPPLTEQCKIAAICSAVARAIEATKSVIESIQALKKSLMQNLLTRGLPHAHSSFKSTDVGELPESWNISSIGSSFRLDLGKMLSKLARNGENLRPYLRNANVQWGRFDLEHILQMSFGEDERERFRIEIGDLLVCEGGEIGRSAIWKGEIAECYYQKALHRLRPRDASILSGFAQYYLELKFRYQKSFSGERSQTTIAHLSKERFLELPIPLPSVEEQRTIVIILDSVIEKETQERGYDEALRIVRSALLRCLLSGKIRVRLDEAPA